jgi:hypothetical protein
MTVTDGGRVSSRNGYLGGNAAGSNNLVLVTAAVAAISLPAGPWSCYAFTVAKHA